MAPMLANIAIPLHWHHNIAPTLAQYCNIGRCGPNMSILGQYCANIVCQQDMSGNNLRRTTKDSVTTTTESCKNWCNDIVSYEFLWLRRIIFSWILTISCCSGVELRVKIRLWNALPRTVRSSTLVFQFRSRLKTELFARSYQQSYCISLCVTVTYYFCFVILKSLDVCHVNDYSNTN